MLADYAPLVPGHVVVVPVEYVLSLAAARPAAIAEVEPVVARLRSILGELYGDDFLVVEHGSSLDMPARSACVLHAHLHVLPVSFDFSDDLRSRNVSIVEASDVTDALSRAPRTHPYLLWGNESWTRFAPLTATSDVPRQYARELIARHLEIEAWDWNAFPVKPLLRQTVADIGARLSLQGD